MMKQSYFEFCVHHNFRSNVFILNLDCKEKSTPPVSLNVAPFFTHLITVGLEALGIPLLVFTYWFEREREKHWFVLPLIFAFMGWLLSGSDTQPWHTGVTLQPTELPSLGLPLLLFRWWKNPCHVSLAHETDCTWTR